MIENDTTLQKTQEISYIYLNFSSGMTYRFGVRIYDKNSKWFPVLNLRKEHIFLFIYIFHVFLQLVYSIFFGKTDMTEFTSEWE